MKSKFYALLPVNFDGLTKEDKVKCLRTFKKHYEDERMAETRNKFRHTELGHIINFFNVRLKEVNPKQVLSKEFNSYFIDVAKQVLTQDVFDMIINEAIKRDCAANGLEDITV